MRKVKDGEIMDDKCWKCGTEVAATDKKCGYCYAVLKEEVVEPVKTIVDELNDLKSNAGLSDDATKLSNIELHDYYNLKQIELLTKQQKSIDTIKGMVAFFVVLTVLSLLGSIITIVNISKIFS